LLQKISILTKYFFSTFIYQKILRILSRTTVSNIDNISYIRMIGTEDWNIGAENSVLHHRDKLYV